METLEVSCERCDEGFLAANLTKINSIFCAVITNL